MSVRLSVVLLLTTIASISAHLEARSEAHENSSLFKYLADAEKARKSAMNVTAMNVTPTPDYAACTINSYVAFMYLNQAAVTIAQSVEDCSQDFEPDSEARQLCAADIFGVIQSFWNTASYIAGLVSQCHGILHADAQCATQIMSFMGDFTEFLQGMLSIFITCGALSDPALPDNVIKDNSGDGDAMDAIVDAKPAAREDGKASLEEQRLAKIEEHQKTLSALEPSLFSAAARKAPGLTLEDGKLPTQPPTKLPPLSAGICYYDIGSSVGYLAQAGWLISSSVSTCEHPHPYTNAMERNCVGDVTGVIAAFSDVVGYIGSAASACSGTVHLAGACAADAGTIGNALFGLASASSTLRSACKAAEAQGRMKRLSRIKSMRNITNARGGLVLEKFV